MKAARDGEFAQMEMRMGNGSQTSLMLELAVRRVITQKSFKHYIQ